MYENQFTENEIGLLSFGLAYQVEQAFRNGRKALRAHKAGDARARTLLRMHREELRSLSALARRLQPMTPDDAQRQSLNTLALRAESLAHDLGEAS